MNDNHGSVTGLPLRVQERAKCDTTAVQFLRDVFPDRPITPIPFTKDHDTVHDLLERNTMLAFLADGIAQRQTADTAASLYRSGMHAVVIVKEIVENGVPSFLIFDPDDTVVNGLTEALQAHARTLNKEVSQLTPAEIWDSGAAAALFRIEPAAAFLQNAAQSETTSDPDGIPYTIKVTHYAAAVPGQGPGPVAPASPDTVWGSITGTMNTLLWGRGPVSEPPASSMPSKQAHPHDGADRPLAPSAPQGTSQTQDNLYWPGIAQGHTPEGSAPSETARRAAVTPPDVTPRQPLQRL